MCVCVSVCVHMRKNGRRKTVQVNEYIFREENILIYEGLEHM